MVEEDLDGVKVGVTDLLGVRLSVAVAVVE